jgi:hypothetical protein
MRTFLFPFLLLFCCTVGKAQSSKGSGTIQIQFTPGHPANTFSPAVAIGAAFDGHEKGDMESMLSRKSIAAMKSVGLIPLSYRLRTELEGDVWHWNPKGTWSEAGKKQGYWVSDSVPSKPIQVSYGYALPHRGNTVDNGNNSGFSRLDDGDEKTFWKSNPYLDAHFTKEPNTSHPQWVVIDLGKLYNINALRIKWGNPFATSFQIQYALDIGSDYFEPFQEGLWHSFSTTTVSNEKGGEQTVVISNKPVQARLVRLLMTQNAFKGNGKDVRDKLGFAIREIGLGLLDANGHFTDWVKHAANHKKQTRMWVSSTDPWHRAVDIDYNTEQAGIDRFFTCGLTGNQPTMMPIGLVYDTPENMEALLKYLRAKHYPIEELEMGEEPEGQLIAPVDYANLYMQWGDKLKRISPDIRFGGPGFAGLAFIEHDSTTFDEARWTELFFRYLQQHGKANYFNFFTTEWYPFSGDCDPSWELLSVAPQRLTTALKNVRRILPANVPIYITEYGFSAFSTTAEVEMAGGLLYADILAKFLTLGGSKAYLYGYEPAYMQGDECGWGNNMLFCLDDDGKIQFTTAAYQAMKMLTHHWATPAEAKLEVYPAALAAADEKEQALVSAYAIRRPDNRWSVMMINKDPEKEKTVKLAIVNAAEKTTSFLRFPAQLVQYSGKQYQWKSNASKGHPTLNLPPVIKTLHQESPLTLPPFSLTVITEN